MITVKNGRTTLCTSGKIGVNAEEVVMSDMMDGLEEEQRYMDKLSMWTACGMNSIVLDKEQMDALERYHNELLYWNERINMISRKDTMHIWDRHILHSLAILKYVKLPQKARVLDIGTGGGLPGIPLKIARPDVHMLMVDSIRKKITCTEMFAQHTGLKDIQARCCRVEDLGAEKHYRQHFDVIVSRAVGRVSVLLDWALPLMRPSAVCYFLKGGDLQEEISEALQTHRGLTVQEVKIDLLGVPWFKEEDKKIIVCTM